MITMANGLTSRKHFFKKAAVAALGIASAPALFARGSERERTSTDKAETAKLPVRVQAAKGTVVHGSVRS